MCYEPQNIIWCHFFYEIIFHKKLVVGTFILRITGFVALKINGFDPILVEFGDITINM